MSTHLLIAAMYLEDVPQSRKLVLAAIADSADEHTLESAPGLPKLRAWSGLGKSQALESVKALEASGHIERIQAGRLGRRAVYRVFPAGVPAIPHPDEVKARYEPVSTPCVDPVDNSLREGPAHRTLGSGLTPTRVRPTGPLHTNTSVPKGAAPSKPVETATSSTGFPGSRATAEEDRGIRARAKGAIDTPCPHHPDQVVPCRLCAAAARRDRERDPEYISKHASHARAAIAAAREEREKPHHEQAPTEHQASS